MKLPTGSDGSVIVELTVNGERQPRWRLSRASAIRLARDLLETYQCACGFVHHDGEAAGPANDDGVTRLPPGRN